MRNDSNQSWPLRLDNACFSMHCSFSLHTQAHLVECNANVVNVDWCSATPIQPVAHCQVADCRRCSLRNIGPTPDCNIDSLVVETLEGTMGYLAASLVRLHVALCTGAFTVLSVCGCSYLAAVYHLSCYGHIRKSVAILSASKSRLRLRQATEEKSFIAYTDKACINLHHLASRA